MVRLRVSGLSFLFSLLYKSVETDAHTDVGPTRRLTDFFETTPGAPGAPGAPSIIGDIVIPSQSVYCDGGTCTTIEDDGSVTISAQPPLLLRMVHYSMRRSRSG